MDIAKIDNLIKQGDFVAARALIEAVDVAKISRSKLPEFCSLARRAELWNISLRVLRPFVRPKVKSKTSATPAEKIEYAMALRLNGALAEADLLMKDPQIAKEPMALLVRGYSCQQRWDYSGALKLIDEALKSNVIIGYPRLIARLNRLACLNSLQSPNFEEEVKALQEDLRKGKAKLLLANSLEIMGQYWIRNKQFAKARKVLAEAKDLIGSSGGSNSLYVDKWLTIEEALRTNSVDVLEKFRKRALSEKNFEVLRDIDAHQGALNPASRWLQNAYFGTPFESFREKLRRITKFAPEEWISTGAAPKTKLDPYFLGADDGDIVHRLLVFLLRDLYQTQSIGSIFSALYPGEYYDVEVSRQKVWQIVNRLRRRIASRGWPLVLLTNDDQYIVRLKADASVLLRKRMIRFDANAFFFDRVRERHSLNLKLEEWAAKLGLVPVTARRAIKGAVDAGVITKTGRSRHTRYCLEGWDDNLEE